MPTATSTVDRNYIVDNEFITLDTPHLFFGDKEEIILVPESYTMADILVDAGIFPSKSQAQKNWKRSSMTIPEGFNDFQHIGKLRHRITILRPTAANLE